MRIKIFILLISTLILAPPCAAQPDTTQYWHWYTTPEISRPVAADPDSMMKHPHALQFSDGRVLVVYRRSALDYHFLIIDRYGQLTAPQSVHPAVFHSIYGDVELIHDGAGGAVFCWPETLDDTQRTQRINSEGEICWSDSGANVYPEATGHFDICIDGNGGFYLAIAPEEPEDDFYDLYLQHIDSLGQVTFGGRGVVVAAEASSQWFPKVTPDGTGGCYVVWVDHRPPYSSNPAFFMQRFYSTGRAAWEPGGQFLCYAGTFHQLLPDGECGFLIHTSAMGGGGYANSVSRIDSTGNILWTVPQVSWYLWAEMIPGDSIYFYLGFAVGNPSIGYWTYGQRMDIYGNVYWPGQYGAEFGYTSELALGGQTYAYHDDLFFAFYELHHFDHPFDWPKYLYTQALDIDGNKTMVDSSVLTAIVNGEELSVVDYLNIVPDGVGGAVGVWSEETGYNPYTFDVYGKHVNADGTLGGPDPRIKREEPTPQISGVLENRIYFEIPSSGRVQIDLYNLLGQRVRTIGNARLPSGAHSVHFDRANLSSGIYFVRIKTPQGECSGKVAIIR